MSLISTAISGMRVSQLGLSTTGHNIVNAGTEGFSRQSITNTSTQPIQTGVGFIGNGAITTEVFRNTEKFLVDQVATDISALSDVDAYLSNITQLDNLFAGDQTNLSQSINKFFDAFNEATNDPSSLLGRQLLLTESRLLTSNFKQLETRLLDQNQTINKQLDTIVSDINSLGVQIAELNRSISSTFSAARGQQPNDLLDKRDQALRDLAKLVDISTIDRGNGTLDVAIGQGQPLVSGVTTRTLLTIPGAADPARRELAFVDGNTISAVGQLLSGGELGGLRRFREEALDTAFNSLGRIALGLVDAVNQQHQLGVDLEGNLGKALFTDINSPVFMRDRVREFANNSLSANRSMTVAIDDIAQLAASDYELQFSGPSGRFSVLRLSDGKVVAQDMLGSKLPHEINVDGLKITLESGSFQNGDRFLIQPGRGASSNMQLLIRRPEEFALAGTLLTQAAAGNLGGGFISAGQTSSVDTAFFNTASNSLSPPVIIRFTSATTYDVLDNSDPANPKPLVPALMNQVFVPGSSQTVFPDDPGGTTVSSTGPAVARLQFGSASNGYPGELITVQKTDPLTGFITVQQVTMAANQSADSVAAQLTALTGVKANASSQMTLSAFTSGSNGEALSLSLNGVDLSTTSAPNPLTADFLRDSINASSVLQAQGIRASSDGGSLKIVSTTGVDLTLGLADADASVLVSSPVTGLPGTNFSGPASGDPATQLTVGGSIDVQLAANMELSSNSNAGVFTQQPEARSNFTGYQVTLGSGTGQGAPQAGDSFSIDFNRSGSADNRNGLAMMELSSAPVLSNGNLSYQGAYGQMVEELGILTNQANLSQSAGASLLRQSMNALQSVSGVNVEEEAARLIELEQQFNASARLIGLARDLFDTLLNM
ncbi:MAG: flagellar hook-associated protein FlgK [Pseudomonadales bacterium]|nr:flagellar hook-associated protein FlgK [Pseudomonadales bacterium]